MAIKYDKYLKHIREQDGEIRAFDNESALNMFAGAYDGELVFVKPNSVYAWNANIITWELARNRTYSSVGDMNAVTGKTGEIVCVPGVGIFFWTGTAWRQSASLAMDSITDPATDAAVTTPKVNAYSGTVVTLTTTGNTQTLQAPTLTTAGKRFTVVNNDSSTNSLTVVGATTQVLNPGEAFEFIRDGSAWSSVAVTENVWERVGTLIQPITAGDSLNLRTGTLYGGTASAGNLTLQSTQHATKGKILFGTSAYDEVNNRLGIGTTAPTSLLTLRAVSPNTTLEATGFSHNFTQVTAYTAPNVVGGMTAWGGVVGGLYFTGIGNSASQPDLTFYGASNIQAGTPLTVSAVQFIAAKRGTGSTIALEAGDIAFDFSLGATSWGIGDNLIRVLGSGDIQLGNTAAKSIIINPTANTVAGRALTISAGSTVTAGTADLVGGNLNLNSGLGKGTGASNIIFSTGRTLTTGSTLQTLTEAGRFLGDGSLQLGSTTNPLILSGSYGVMFGIHSTAAFSATTLGASFGMAQWSATTAGPVFSFLKSRGTTVGSYVATASGDNILQWDFATVNSANNPTISARILIQQTAVATSAYNEASMIFSTSSGNTAITEKMRLTGAGSLSIGDGNSVAGERLRVIKNQNGETYTSVINATDGIAALAGTFWSTTSDVSANYLFNGVTPASRTPSGIYTASTAFVSTNGVKLNIGTRSDLPVSLWSNNTERMTITGAGNVGIGGTPLSKLHIFGSNYILENTAATYAILINSNPSAGDIIGGHAFKLTQAGVNYGLIESVYVSSGNGDLKFSTLLSGTGAEKMRITGAGTLAVGTATPYNLLPTAIAVPFHSNVDGSKYSINISTQYSSDNTYFPWFYFAKGRGTQASPAVVISGDILGKLSFAGQYTTTVNNIAQAVSIHGVATETWSGSTNAADMVFSTNPTGTFSTPVERMRITSSGTLLVGTTLATDWGVAETIFQVDGGTRDYPGVIYSGFNNTPAKGFISQGYLRGRGTNSSPTAIQSGDVLGNFSFYAQYGSVKGNIAQAARIGSNATTTFSSVTAGGANLTLSTFKPTVGTTIAMIIDENQNVGIGTTAPDKKLEINSATGACLRLTYNDADGTAAVKADFDVSSTGDLTITTPAAKTVVLATTVYDDIMISAYNLRGGSSAPDYIAFQNSIYAAAFKNGSTDIVYGSFEIPHTYKEGTDLEVHVHRSPSTTDTGACVFNMAYSIAGMGGTFGAEATKTFTQAGSGVVNKHQYVSGNTVISGAGLTIGTVVVFAFSRPTGDAFTGDAFVHSIGVHYQIDTMGSRSASSK